jgi:lysophospholipase
MTDLLSRLNISNFDARSYMNSHAQNISALPNIAIAASGGGYRATMNGGGAISAFDSRTANSSAPGQLGGVLQASTYFSGLSGGAWLVGSIYVNNFTQITALLANDSNPVWNFDDSILQGPSDQTKYWIQLQTAVSSKEDAGFEVSITDYW